MSGLRGDCKVCARLTSLPYFIGGLPQVGSECGAWPESGWRVDLNHDGIGFFSPSSCFVPFQIL